MNKGDNILFFMVWLSAVGLIIIAKFFPWMLVTTPLPNPLPQPMPWWGLPVMSAPVFLVWIHFLYIEIKKLIKKYKK